MKYNAAQCSKSAHFFPTNIHFFHTILLKPAREAKPHFSAALTRSTHDCETDLLATLELKKTGTEGV